MLRRRIMMAPIGDKNTITLLHFDGNMNNSTEIPQTWGSDYQDPTTTYSTSIKKFGTSSVYSTWGIAGEPYYFVCYNDDNIFYNYLGSDWTVEKWIYITSNGFFGGPSGNVMFTLSTNAAGDYGKGYFLMKLGLASIRLEHSTDGNSTDFSQNYTISALPTNAWYHVAAVKHNNLVTIYINGVAVVSNVSWPYTPNSAFVYSTVIGFSYTYHDEFRFSNIARWTANFTPPTAAYE